MKQLKSASHKSVLRKLHNFSNFIVKKIFKMTELQLISKLSEMEQPTQITSVRVKAPKRILHFSDGILEEYSSDDEIDGPSNQNKQSDEKQTAPATLIDHMWMGGSKVLAACDYVGEKLAAALGITTPKYSYEIEQIKKMQKEREKAIEEEICTGGWMQQTFNTQFKQHENQINVAHEPIVSQNGLQKY